MTTSHAGTDAWLDRVRHIRSWQTGGRRAPHKPLLLLYMLGRLQRDGSASAAFREAAEPLLRDYSASSSVQRPEYPFYHLRSDGLWQLTPPLALPPGRSPSASQLRSVEAVGSLPPDLVTALKDDPRLFATIARYLLDANFEPSVHQDICEAVGLDLASLEDELENLVLICPNHHAAIHQVDAPFDFGELAFEFVRGERTWWERLQLNRHLPRAA